MFSIKHIGRNHNINSSCDKYKNSSVEAALVLSDLFIAG